MPMERRDFVKEVLALGLGVLALVKGRAGRAQELPSAPGSAAAPAAGADEIALPAFAKDSAFPLDQALGERKTSRDFDPEAVLTPEQLSRLLWAANGVNRTDGHRTTPSAMARYPVEVYVALPEGVYRYEVKEHKLARVSGKDIRDQIPLQPGLKKAAMKLLYVIDRKKAGGDDPWMADLEIGCMVQDVYLEAASLDLGCCVFAIVRREHVSQALGLDKNKIFRIAQAVGPRRPE